MVISTIYVHQTAVHTIQQDKYKMPNDSRRAQYTYICRAICSLIRFAMIFPRPLFFSHTLLRFFSPISIARLSATLCMSIGCRLGDQSIKHGHSIDKEKKKEKNENGIFRARAFLIINFTHHRSKTASHTHVKINDAFSYILLFIFVYTFTLLTQRWGGVRWWELDDESKTYCRMFYFTSSLLAWTTIEVYVEWLLLLRKKNASHWLSIFCHYSIAM
jgi:hypothetical protein